MIFSFSLSDHLLFTGVTILVLLVPGLAWLISFKKDDRDLAERLADALGISVSLLALLSMVFFFMKIELLSFFLVVLFGFLAGYLIRQVYAKKRMGRNDCIQGGLTLLVLGLVVLFRFYQAKDLVFPAWVDSVHHVLIIQKILDYGGLPSSLNPELDVPFYYHYGFHLVSAVFTWISKAPLVGGVIWLGQVINGLVIAGVYRFGKSVTGSWRAALAAALLTGFAFQMPAYYLTWGRYTLLAGLLIMLPAMAVSYELVYQKFTRERFWRLVVLSAGLALAHYLSLFYFGIYLLTILAVRLAQSARMADKADGKMTRMLIVKIIAAAGIGVGLASPWFLRMLLQTKSAMNIQLVLPTEGNQNAWRYFLRLLGPEHNYVLMGLAVLILLILLIKGKMAGFSAWAVTLAMLSVPWGLHFGPFRSDHHAIILFIPAAILIGYGSNWLYERNLIKVRTGWIGFIVLLLVVLLAWGALNTKEIINPTTILADQADADALAWIEENTPQNARFLSNTAHWQFGAYRGVNGGYWILPLTRRFSTAMPGLYSYGENRDVEEWLNWMERAAVVHACDDGFWSLVKDAQLTHVYLREGKGALQPDAMVDCPNVEMIYSGNGVWLYQIMEGE